MGFTSARRATRSGYAAAYAAVTRPFTETPTRFFRVDRMNLVGVSVNGLVTAAYAAAYPDRVARLALVNPIAPTAESQSSYHPPERTARIDSSAQRELMRLRESGGSREAICRQF